MFGFLSLMHYNIRNSKELFLLDEAGIIARVRAGQKDAFAEIVECYQAPILRYIYRMTGDYETARDLAQNTFVQAYQGILKTSAELSFKAWLYRIATNNVMQSFRRRRRLRFIILSRSGGNSPLNTVSSHLDLEENIAIKGALLKVPRTLRICMVLHFIEGFKYREIAGILNTSEDAVRMRVTRGSQQFRKFYQEEVG